MGVSQQRVSAIENGSVAELSTLAGDPATAWSGLTICRLDQAGPPQLAGGGPVMKTGRYPFVIARHGALSYLTVRDLPDGGGLEFGSLAYGYHADDAAAALVGQLRASGAPTCHRTPSRTGRAGPRRCSRAGC